MENNELKRVVDELIEELCIELSMTEYEVKLELMEILTESFKNN